MGVITPTFADDHRANGAAPPPLPRIVPAHEPLATGEQPRLLTAPIVEVPEPPQAAPAPAPQPPLKIALVGTAPSSRMLAPYGDPTWKIWACSPGNMQGLPRADAWFEIHSNLTWPEHQGYGIPYLDWLRGLKIPVYMQDQSLVPNAIPYPKDEMVSEHGRFFFTSSFAWMMALAIKMGCTELGLYGIDMASRDEYILQRSGGQYFIQIARQRGIKVVIPHESDLAQPPPLYGYADSNAHMRKWQARRKEIKDRVAGMIAQRDSLNHSITYLQGADEDMDYNISIWGGLADDVALLEAENARLKRDLDEVRAQRPT